MGNSVQTIPISAAALREVDIVGTFRYANTYSDLTQLITHRYHGLAEVDRAFKMAGRSHDEAGRMVLKVVV